MNKEEFINELKKINIEVTPFALKKIEQFYNLLIIWNEKMNLTTITDCEEVYLKHFFDSLTLAKVFDFNKELKICDVGSGAGFPGIVLKIFFPKLKITLVDSLQKRVHYLDNIIKELDLFDIKAVHARMEDFCKICNEEYDLITARAVANLNILLEISVRALKVNGTMLFMKANCDEEIAQSKHALEKLSCEITDISKFKLPKEDSNRTIITIVKKESTRSMYPRNISKIRKAPL